jgi:hypothetical protein
MWSSFEEGVISSLRWMKDGDEAEYTRTDIMLDASYTVP